MARLPPCFFRKRRPPAKIASRLRPHLVRRRKIDGNRTEKLRAAGLMKDGEQIRFVANRTHDGQPLAGKIRSAWEGILDFQEEAAEAFGATR